MQQITINLIATPFLAGFVGYITNYLAIKMLFRPHTRKWYSFGWQGVIPKNKNKLAQEMGSLVGRELIQETDIKNAILNEHFQNVLQKSIENELKHYLKKEHEPLGIILKKFGVNLNDVIEKSIFSLTNNSNIVNLINENLDSLLNIIMKDVVIRSLSEINDIEGKIKRLSRSLISKGSWQELVAEEFSSYLNNFVLSGQSLADILPEAVLEKVDNFALYITDKILDYLDTLFEDPTSQKRITEKILEIKNSYFSGGGFLDQLKHGVINVFLTEEKISELVKNEIPKIVKGISSDNIIKTKIKDAIADRISTFLYKPIYSLVESVGVETLFQIRVQMINGIKQYLKSDSLREKFENFLLNQYKKYSSITIAGALKTIGIDPLESIKGIINIETLATPSNVKNFSEFLSIIIGDIKLGNLYDKFPEHTFESMRDTVVKEVNIILEKNLSSIVGAVNIQNIVEEKIKGLNLYQVENMLFSFMQDQFTWINILGFVLGFLFGLTQSIVLYLIK